MNKREYCESHETIAYYSGLNGLELKGIEYGIEDYAYFVSGAWSGQKEYHRVKINYETGVPYCMVYGNKIPFDEVILV